MSGAIGDSSEGRTAWAPGPVFPAAAKGAAARAKKDESSRAVEACFRLALGPVPILLGDMAAAVCCGDGAATGECTTMRSRLESSRSRDRGIAEPRSVLLAAAV